MPCVFDGLLRHPPAARGGAKGGLGRVYVTQRSSGETAALGFFMLLVLGCNDCMRLNVCENDGPSMLQFERVC